MIRLVASNCVRGAQLAIREWRATGIAAAHRAIHEGSRGGIASSIKGAHPFASSRIPLIGKAPFVCMKGLSTAATGSSISERSKKLLQGFSDSEYQMLSELIFNEIRAAPNVIVLRDEQLICAVIKESLEQQFATCTPSLFSEGMTFEAYSYQSADPFFSDEGRLISVYAFLRIVETKGGKMQFVVGVNQVYTQSGILSTHAHQISFGAEELDTTHRTLLSFDPRV